MANWESMTVSDVITNISENTFVLPVIQRKLVWDEEKMELLLDTLLKGNSFGGIMTIQEDASFQALFAFRYFTKDAVQLDSISVDKEQKRLVEDKEINGKNIYCSQCFSSNVGMISGCSEPTCFDCGYSKCS